MIRVSRPESVSDILRIAGATARDALCAAYEAGERELAFDARLYAAPEVKAALQKAQHGKCAFCERQIGADSDIEHFRPKAAVQQRKGGKVQRPGYYWLAYEWSNLLLSCTHCNCRHKRNLFPLLHPRRRAKHHNQALTREEPLLIDPATEDPAQCLDFRDEVIYAIDGDKRGEETIRVLGLNREALHEERLSLLQLLRQLHVYATALEAQIDNADSAAVAAQIRADIDERCADSEPFAAMARAARRRGFHPFAGG